MTPNRLLLATLTLTLFTACAQPPKPNTTWQTNRPLPEFEATGRIAIQTPDRSHQANFAWTRTAHIQNIDIRLPIGGNIGQLCADQQGAQLTTYNGQIHRADNLTQLSQNLLGYTLPITDLDHWINGQTAPNQSHSITPEGHLQQSGWHIQRHTNEQGQPRLITLQRPDITLRLAFSTFDTPSNAPTSCND